MSVVLHCFSMPEHLEECLERGYVISFAGNVTYKSAAELAEAAARVPEERLLVETDAPYLTPQAVRKKRNQPAFVAHTLAFLAELRGVSAPSWAERRAQRRPHLRLDMSAVPTPRASPASGGCAASPSIPTATWVRTS